MTAVKLYRVSGTVTISVFTEVMAKDEDDARKLAKKAGMRTLCHGCSSVNEDEPEWTTTELDGDVHPDSIEVEEAT